MTILESCREASEITIKYQFYQPEGLLLTFPTDGTEDEYGQSVGFTERFINKGSSLLLERTPYRQFYCYWYSCISQSNIQNGDDYVSLCGQKVYFRKLLALSTAADENQQPSALSRVEIVNESVFAERKTTELTLEDKPAPGTTETQVWDYDADIAIPDKQAPGCAKVTASNNTVFFAQPGTIVYEGYTSIAEYYDTKVVRDDGYEQFVTTRTSTPASTIRQEVELLPEEEVTISKNPTTEDFEVRFGVGFLRIDVVNVASGSKQKLWSESLSFSPLPPEWSHNCGQECPENTCKVLCDTHYCCYNSQGIPVASFPVEA